MRTRNQFWLAASVVILTVSDPAMAQTNPPAATAAPTSVPMPVPATPPATTDAPVQAAPPTQAAPRAPTAAPAATSADLLPKDLSVSAMFRNADIVVQAVLVGLIAASVVTWTILLAKGITILMAQRSVRVALADAETQRSLAELQLRLRGLPDGDVRNCNSPPDRTHPASRNASPHACTGSRRPPAGGSHGAPGCWPRSGRPPRSSACSAPSGAS
jgi:hypothetical protein